MDLLALCKSRNYEVTVRLSENGVSGALPNEKRTVLQELLKKARDREFEIVLISELSRIGRSAFEVSKVIEELISLNVNVFIQNLNIETLPNGKRSPMTDLLIAIVNQFSQMERTTLIERINSGIAKARSLGVRIGRPPDSSKSPEQFLKEYSGVAKDLERGLPLRKVALLNNVSVNTVQKVKRLVSN
jgi:DNA invertase Pin-like site-specific DNA recombinase